MRTPEKNDASATLVSTHDTVSEFVLYLPWRTEANKV